MKLKFWILAILLAWFGCDAARAQQAQPVVSEQPDCFRLFDFTAQSTGAQASGSVSAGSTGTTSVIDNTQAGCLDWLVAYSTTTTVSGVSLAFQTATNLAGAPGTWGNYPGTLTTGINPNTAVGNGAVTDATGAKYPFLRMNLISLSGTGRVQGILYGWKRRPTYVNVTAGGGCPGTVGTPCVVVGPDASGSPAAHDPVLVAGNDNNAGDVHTLLTDAIGQLLVDITKWGNDAVATATTPGAVVVEGPLTNNNAAPVANQVPVMPSRATAAAPTYAEGNQVLNSLDLAGNQRVGQVNQTGTATFERQFSCTNQALFNLSASGNTQIIAASGATTIRICHISFSTTAAEDVKITRGAGVDCATGPTDVTGLYKSVQAAAFDFSPTSALRGAASGAICMNQSAAQALGGVVIYAQF